MFARVFVQRVEKSIYRPTIGEDDSEEDQTHAEVEYALLEVRWQRRGRRSFVSFCCVFVCLVVPCCKLMRTVHTYIYRRC